MTFKDEVLRLCSEVPKGKVTTYGEIAHALNTSAYRAVGQALRHNDKPIIIPCHRVVRSDGSVGGYSGIIDSEKKVMLLKKEGIEIKNGKIKKLKEVLHKY